MLKGKKVFISGGAGVIGCELVPKLLSLGAELFVGDLKPQPIEYQNKLIYRQGDLRFLQKWELEAFQPEIFIHLAATFERSEETYEFWYENFAHNVFLSNHLTTLIKDSLSIKKIIFASSYLIYDKSLYMFDRPQETARKLIETDPISPRNLTGMAKLAHEVELDFIKKFRGKDIQIVTPRIFRGFGRGSRDVISRWVKSLIKDEEIFLYGKEAIFDYIYAKDTAEGLVRIVDDNEIRGIVNLGTGIPHRVSDVVATLKSYFPNAKVTEKPSDILYESSQADTTLLKQYLKWTPDTSLNQAISEIVDYEVKLAKKNIKEVTHGNVLISSVSKKIPMVKSVKSAMQRINKNIKVFGADSDPNALAKHFCDSFWEMPLLKNLSLEKIIEFTTKNNIFLIIPSRDGELEFWSKLKAPLLERGVHVMVSSLEALQKSIDKFEFSKSFHDEAYLSIPTYLNPQQGHSVEWVVKERYGAGSRSMGIGLNYEQAIEHSKALVEPIFQPMIKNQKEISVDIYVTQNYVVKGMIMRTRDLVVNGESQITTNFFNKKIESAIEKFAKKTGLLGHLVIQAFVDQDKVTIIECNARFGGASSFSNKLGVDSFFWFYQECLGMNIEKWPQLELKNKFVQLRYPEDVLRECIDL